MGTPAFVYDSLHDETNCCLFTSILMVLFVIFQAASDSLRLMGNRKFYDQLIADTCQHEKDRITDEIDVTTMKDYMQVHCTYTCMNLKGS